MNSAATYPIINPTQVINAHPLGTYQKLIVLLIVLVFIMDGVANTVLPVAIPSLMKEWGLSRDPFRFVVGAGLMGVAMGAVLGGYLCDKVGRRRALIGCVVLFGGMTALSSLVQNVHQLMIVRVLDGLGIGGAIPAGMALLFESMPVRRRSIAIASSMVGIPLGGFLAGGLASLVLESHGWHTLFLLGGLAPLVLAAVLAGLLPDSPAHLALKPDRNQELRHLMGRYGHEFPQGTTFVGEGRTGPKARLRDLFNAEFSRSTVLLWAAFFFCFIASYSMFSWGPVMMMGQGLSPKTMGIGISIFNVGGVVGGLASGWVLQKFGSRLAFLLYCGGGMASAMSCAVAFQYNAQVVAFTMPSLAAFGFFTAGLLNLTYTMGANLYPPYIKGTGLGAGAGIGRIGAVISAFAGVAALNFGAAMGFFMVITIALFITLVSALAIRQQIARVG